MTPRTSIARLADDAPVPHPDSWPARKPSFVTYADCPDCGATDMHEFLNRVRRLFFIDGDLLPELTRKQQLEFVRDPVRYLMTTDFTQQKAIWREVEKRQ